VTESTVATPESEAVEPVLVDDEQSGPGGASSVSAGSGDSASQAAAAAPIAQDPAPTPNGRIGEILVAAGAIDQAQLDEALEGQKSTGDRLGTVLIDTGVATRAQVTEALASQYGVPALSLDRAVLDPKAVTVLDEETSRSLGVVPLSRSSGRTTIAVGDPARPNVFEDVLAAATDSVAFVIVDEDRVAETIDKAYQASAAVSDAVRVFEARASERGGAAAAAVTDIDSSAPIVQVVNTILTQAVRDRASDVHIEPMGDRVRIRNRIDGALHEVLSLPQSMAQALVSRIKIMADMNIVERRRPQDGQMEAEVDGSMLDIRISTTSTQYGEKTVLRILDKARALYDLSTLGMPADTAELYADIIKSPYGMVVCAGPTGSGKTTTLYASLMAINSDEINVMTVEDPVEYTFPTINQISIHEQAGVTFAAGLRSILRQDPDAILVGEIRDVETARIAIQAALTGHFVLSTIHATDATSALHRFLDMGIESFLLASSMLAVVGQRLIRRNCTECLAPYEPAAEDLAFYERAGGKPKEQFIHGAGCAACSGTGYVGRIGVYEVLRVTDEMRDLVVRNAPVDEIRKLAVDQGMVPLRDQALRLVADDVTTIAEVMRTIYIL
jgi:type IV pilus assembly protein PilB